MNYEVMDPVGAIQQMLGLIRAGTYPWVAARAAGLSDAAFKELLAESRPGRPSLRGEILKAQAMARAKAEIELKAKDPLGWLRYGPGRPSRAGPGWTAPAKAALDSEREDGIPQGDLDRFLERLRRFAEENPDVRLNLAAFLGGPDRQGGDKE